MPFYPSCLYICFVVVQWRMPAAAGVMMRPPRIPVPKVSQQFCSIFPGTRWLPACKKCVNESGHDEIKPWGKTGGTVSVV